MDKTTTPFETLLETARALPVDMRRRLIAVLQAEIQAQEELDALLDDARTRFTDVDPVELEQKALELSRKARQERVQDEQT